MATVPKVSAERLLATRRQILDGARRAFADHGYEAATVRVLEREIGLSRGAIFHHFRDKESLFLAVAEDDAAEMAAVVAKDGLVQVMRDLLDGGEPSSLDRAGWLGTQLEVSRRVRTDPDFARRWAARSEAVTAATRERLARQRELGVLREDVGVEVIQRFLELALDGLVLRLAMGM
ncbi:MAG: TetR/AcrR family transcriptional regulator, transcriptional repressor of aconitase, partial [Frankiales bacterium]|nr:TetR/AcrR family transcriptional regulator, transcriptional repressor of aconitase [Frankiales bacterium]